MRKFLMVLLSIAFVLNLAIEDGQTGCPSFFVYWGCAKETKIFCNSVKRQKFIQRIAGIVVLCYNEQRRRMNRA